MIWIHGRVATLLRFNAPYDRSGRDAENKDANGSRDGSHALRNTKQSVKDHIHTRETIHTGSYNGGDFTTGLSFITPFTIELASEPVMHALHVFQVYIRIHRILAK